MKHLKRSLLIIALLFLAGTLPALAHTVNLFAYVEGGTVYTESYFPDGRPVEGGRVVVFDSSGTELLTGTTDTLGLFRFAIPKVDDLRIVIDAGMGHRNDFTILRSELEAGQ